ncbi:MAG: hypothetical protein JWN00_1068, partial [Actinomycetia bacterium]|nr:hypothetical protein [Actinomycetes bacterium]
VRRSVRETPRLNVEIGRCCRAADDQREVPAGPDTAAGFGTHLSPLASWLGYLIGLVLLLVVSSVAWSELAFPVWVLAVNCFLTTFHAQRARTPP